jgi:hypothetical protein
MLCGPVRPTPRVPGCDGHRRTGPRDVGQYHPRMRGEQVTRGFTGKAGRYPVANSYPRGLTPVTLTRMPVAVSHPSVCDRAESEYP